MLIIESIVGQSSDPGIADQLHELEHHGVIETLRLSGADVQRHRLRAFSDRGTDCAIRLERHHHLSDGAVLWLDEQRAIVVQLDEQRHLLLQPRDAAAALELGYFAGNMHWKVRFSGGCLAVLMAGPEDDYLERLKPMLADRRVERCDS